MVLGPSVLDPVLLAAPSGAGLRSVFHYLVVLGGAALVQLVLVDQVLVLVQRLVVCC